jgi:hypothetical protein
MHPFLTISLRHQAIFMPESTAPPSPLRETTSVLLANLYQLGFTVTESLRDALNGALPTRQLEALETVRTVLGMNKNWTPLVKGWQVPTGENEVDHMVTWFVNLVGGRGTALPCGHVIPPGTFPLERYNGCPFCGTPFHFGSIEYDGQGSAKKPLDLWQQADVEACFANLLQSKTALDATQRDSLTMLLRELPLPDVPIVMKETALLVMASLVERGLGGGAQAQALLKSPADVIRYLWFKKTGLTQIVEPRTIVSRKRRNSAHCFEPLDQGQIAATVSQAELKLKYTRGEARQAALWLNGLTMEPDTACEVMHPKRRMWVRFIRALRLVEFAHKPGFEKLAALLAAFHQQTYPVHAGIVQKARLKRDAAETFRLLKQRPGLFARSLFANMLWHGPEGAIKAFAEVVDAVPARLIFSLQSMAENYFTGQPRTVKPLGSHPKTIQGNKLRQLYSREALAAMPLMIDDLCLTAMRKRFAALSAKGKTQFIDPILFKMPVAIGERSETVQDLPSALAGMRFPVLGDTVRLFMQWGMGLPAQHLDMDLSCRIAFPAKEELCAFHSLTATGCKHSGDIRHVPAHIGTAEYIEIDVVELERAGATHVTFACNAYSWGSLTPELIVGWMTNEHPMTISSTSGVAYDPSCVQHQVRVNRSLAKGLVFGVLDIATREIIWLEMAFGGQVMATLDTQGVKALLAKLSARISIGNLLTIKAEAQGLTLLDHPGADEDYTATWALDAAAVTALLVD